VTRRASPRLGAYAGLAALGLLASLVLGLPELVVLAAPFALLLAAGLALGRAPQLEVEASVERERALEGEELEAEIRIASESAVERLEVLLALPYGLRSDPAHNPATLRLAAGEERTGPETRPVDTAAADAPADALVDAGLGDLIDTITRLYATT
jgi:uncharacterized protein (DUF58 family)